MFCWKLGNPFCMLVFTYLWLWWATCIHVKASEDSLKPGDTLDASGALCSKNGTYCMGFGPCGVAIDDTAHPLTYFCIYAGGQDNWIVWIGNRYDPIVNNSGVLSLDHSGVLQIESQDRAPIVLHSSSKAINNNTDLVATLLDTGNFVLQQLHPNGSVLWQSFDHPSDILLPGMKLGVNHKTGHNWSLSSYTSSQIPTPGPFRLEWDPKTRELVIRRRTRVYWRSGELRNNRFQHIPNDVQVKHKYIYTIVSDKDEDTFTFTTLNGRITKWALLETGQLISRDSREGYDIARADSCYGYNTDRGCQIWEELPTCRHHGDVFKRREGYPTYSDNTTTSEENATYGVSDCKASCWSNCNCIGFQTIFANGTGCIYFLGKSTEGINFASGGNDFYVLVNDPQDKGTKMWTWISTIIAIALLIICSSILCLVLKKRKYVLEEKKRKGLEAEVLDLAANDESSSVKDLEDDLKKGHDLKVFSFASVMAATNGFLSENKLGQGGFGPVYKGTLPTGQEVAVKRLSRTSGQGVVEFKNELTLISELQHTNLVQLLGCCIQEHERILIYEYMPNKSLDFFLFDSTRSKLLDWKKRFNIIEGISQGILYLHKYSRLKVIHRDLKASNILLDENMNPKIADFGMARIFTQHEALVNTNRIVGTYGYMSPEYAMEGVFSTRSDVYSFGVLMLEIVSGKRNNSFYNSDGPVNLLGYAWELWKEGASLQLMDPSLKECFVEEEVLRCIHVGLLCVEECADDRPTMSDIISMLTNKSAAVAMPKRPAFYAGRKIVEGKTSCESYTDSKYEVSVSDVESR